jgi:hypothetical protein
MYREPRRFHGQLSRRLRCRCRSRMVDMMSASASSVVVGPGVAVVIMVVTSRRVGVDVVVVSGAEEEEGLEEEMMEEEVVTSEGCRTVVGVRGVVRGVLLRRRRPGHLGGGMPRLTGGDHHFALEFFFLRSALFILICFRLLWLSIIVETAI